MHVGPIVGHVGALDVGFDAEHHRAQERIGLPVVADLAAANRAERLQIGRIPEPLPIMLGPVAAEADAGVDAEIKAGPVVEQAIAEP